ncbi:MAG: spondin domain-containing protein [Pseudomonadota bacterium]
MPRLRPLAPALFLAALLPAAAPAMTVEYALHVQNTWSPQQDRDGDGVLPDILPPDAHFSWLGGAVHAPDIRFWGQGLKATPAVRRMAEFGNTRDITDAVVQAGPYDKGSLSWDVADAGDAAAPLAWERWFCPAVTTHPNCGDPFLTLETDASKPEITLLSMIGPSPDWFVGTNGLSLLDENGRWRERIVFDLQLWDGGSRTGDRLVMRGTGFENGVVTRIVAPDDPRLSDPQGNAVSTGQDIGWTSPGRFVFTLLTPQPRAEVPLPASAWLLLAGAGALWRLRRR